MRQEQDGVVSRYLHLAKPVEERDACRRFERRIGNNILTAEIYLFEPHLHCVYARIQSLVNSYHIAIHIEPDDYRGGYSLGNQCACQLSRAAAGIDDPASGIATSIHPDASAARTLRRMTSCRPRNGTAVRRAAADSRKSLPACRAILFASICSSYSSAHSAL